ncbi:MAG: prepilin peptidase [Candidatus Krumholzibacteria bacterium]|nr:prepilin peptidase [Candidatus Krumholzibacteria bacterium]
MIPFVYGCAALFGLLVGSFLNVVIYRVPRGLSIVGPRSFCPRCRKKISWYENIPVASYVALRGRCRGCGERIAVRYPLVESAGAALALAAVYRYGFGVDAAFAFAILMALAAITLIDWDFRIIPDGLSLPFIVVGLGWSLVNPGLTLASSALGALAGGGSLFAIGALYKLARKTEGMGGGDVKLMAMIGAFLGIKLIAPVILIASFAGTLYAIVLLGSGKGAKTAVAFGSFLAPAAAFCLFFGDRLLAWYFRGFGR